MAKKVLLVDDDEMWLSRVSASFKETGYDLVTASDASQAMAAADNADLGLIVLDLNLQGESGLMLMKFLKQNHPRVPILLFTCLDHDDKAIRTMLEMGADQYLPKRSVEELIVTVGAYFKRD